MGETGPARANEEAARRVLIVDRADAARAAVGAHLQASGYDVTFAADGVEALRLAMVHPVDVVVLNAGLPELPAHETATMFRRLHPATEVILTADADAVPAGRERHVERFRCFTRPVDPGELARALRRPAGPRGRQEDAP